MTKQTEAERLADELVSMWDKGYLEREDVEQAAAELRRQQAEIERLNEALAEQPAQQEPVAWRELCRRLYVELFHCDQQMMATQDEEGDPMWQQGATVRDVLADAKAALETSPQPAQRTWVGLTNEDIAEQDWRLSADRTYEEWTLQEQLVVSGVKDFARAIEAKLKEKNT